MTAPSIEHSWAGAPVWGYEAPQPPGVEARLYQHAAVEYCLARDHAIIGDAPGLGKTAEAVLLGNALGARHTLVLCPASLRLNWEREVWRWSTTENVRTYPVLAARDGVGLGADYVITSYELASRCEPLRAALMSRRWDHLVLDEGHYLKDPRGNTRTKAVCGWHDGATYVPGLADVSGRVTLLSGTLMPNQPVECYNAVRLTDHGAIDHMSLDAFQDYYYSEGWGFTYGPYETMRDEQTVVVVGRHRARVRNVPRRVDELRRRLRSRVMVRRLREHVLDQLPAKEWHVFPVDMVSKTAADVRRVMRSEAWRAVEHLYDLDEDAFDDAVPIDGAVSTAYRELGEALAPDMVAYAKQLLDEGVEKLVVGAWHRSVLQVLREGLASYGVAYMDGGTGATARQRAVDAFQEDANVRVILGQIGPLGEGWTLTAAQDVFLPEPWWVPGKNDQFFDRIVRIGQEGDYVLCHVPFVPGTIHERIIGRCVRKARVVHEALDVRD